MPTPFVKLGRLPVLYVAVALTATVIILASAWWVGRGTPRLEASRLAYIELRMLRQARDRLTDHLGELEYKVHQLAHQPEVIHSQEKTIDLEFLAQTIGQLDLEGVCLRRYSPDGKVLFELPVGSQRLARIRDDEIKELLEWGRDPKNADAVQLELVDVATRSDGLARDMVRFAAPIWLKDGSAPARPNGILCLWIPSATLLSSFLPPTHVLPESYTFVLSLSRSVTQPSAAPRLLWHSAEPQWVRSNAADAGAFVGALRRETEGFQEVGEQSKIINLFRQDGGDRREVTAFVPVTFGSKTWIIGLSTPYDVAVEFTSSQRHFMIVLCLLTLGILVVGVLLVVFERRRLLNQATLEQAREIRALQHDYGELFAENPTAMLVLDEESRLVDCNHSAERLIGLARSEAIGSPLAEMFEEQSVLPIWQSLHDRGHLHTRDTVLVRRLDQQAMLLEIWGRLIGEHWTLMAHNVEQRRDLDQQIARLKRMDSMGSLASTLAHDFNNLLGQVQILVSHLRTEVPRGSIIEGDVVAIEKKVEDASQLVANLLASRDHVVSKDPVWLEPVLREFAANQPKVLPEGVQFASEIRADIPSIWITPHAVRRVLDNLCLNACDAMPYGGTLSLRAQGKRIDASNATEQLPEGLYAVVDVSDTGKGMSREVLDTIFDPFFTTKKRGKGIGLGLWTVYRIVRRSGGWVHVHSRLGKGTTFTLYFPHSPPPELDSRDSANTGATADFRNSAPNSAGSNGSSPARGFESKDGSGRS